MTVFLGIETANSFVTCYSRKVKMLNWTDFSQQQQQLDGSIWHSDQFPSVIASNDHRCAKKYSWMRLRTISNPEIEKANNVIKIPIASFYNNRFPIVNIVLRLGAIQPWMLNISIIGERKNCLPILVWLTIFANVEYCLNNYRSLRFTFDLRLFFAFFWLITFPWVQILRKQKETLALAEYALDIDHRSSINDKLTTNPAIYSAVISIYELILMQWRGTRTYS